MRPKEQALLPFQRRLECENSGSSIRDFSIGCQEEIRILQVEDVVHNNISKKIYLEFLKAFSRPCHHLRILYYLDKAPGRAGRPDQGSYLSSACIATELLPGRLRLSATLQD